MRVNKEHVLFLCTIADIAIVKNKGAAEATPLRHIIHLDAVSSCEQRSITHAVSKWPCEAHKIKGQPKPPF